MRNTENIRKAPPATLSFHFPPQGGGLRGSFAFTLVELIIVITILAILATIGFMSYQSYTTDARDGKRKADLGELRNGLEIYQAKNSVLPDPDAQTVTIMSGSNTISVQGYIGANVLQKLRATGDIKDSLDNNYYTYSVNGTKTKYQLLGMFENSSNLAMNDNMLNETYARTDYTNRFAYTTGNKVGVFFSGATNNTPIQETMSGNLDLTTGANATKVFKVMFSNQTTASGTLSITGANLPIVIQTETNSIASTASTSTYSCQGTLVTANATITNNINLTANTNYQNTNSANSCYYTCKSGFSGTNCEIVPTYQSLGLCNLADIVVPAANGYGPYTIASCNIGATTAGMTATSYGRFFKWGDNNGWNNNSTIINYIPYINGAAGTQINSTTYLDTLIGDSVSGGNNRWTRPNNLLQGPCPVGYHVPSNDDWAGIMIAGGWSFVGATGVQISSDLKLPWAGYRDSSGILQGQTTFGIYWSTSAYQANGVYQIFMSSQLSNGIGGYNTPRDNAIPIRCFKN